MREFAFIRLEADDQEISPEAQEQFDAEVALAEEGRWDEIDLDFDDQPLV